MYVDFCCGKSNAHQIARARQWSVTSCTSVAGLLQQLSYICVLQDLHIQFGSDSPQVKAAMDILSSFIPQVWLGLSGNIAAFQVTPSKCLSWKLWKAYFKYLSGLVACSLCLLSSLEGKKCSSYCYALWTWQPEGIPTSVYFSFWEVQCTRFLVSCDALKIAWRVNAVWLVWVCSAFKAITSYLAHVNLALFWRLVWLFVRTECFISVHAVQRRCYCWAGRSWIQWVSGTV